MSDEGEQQQEDSIETLMARAKRGAGAEGSLEYLGDLLWAKLWRSVKALSNLQEPTLERLLEARANIRSIILLAQELQLHRFEGQAAVERIKQMYGGK